MISLEEMEKIWKESKSELKGVLLFFQVDESQSIFIISIFGDGLFVHLFLYNRKVL